MTNTGLGIDKCSMMWYTECNHNQADKKGGYSERDREIPQGD